MNSFVVEKSAVTGEIITINDSGDVNHIRNVLRLVSGNNVRVVDGTYEYIGEIVSADKKSVTVKILEKKEDEYSLNTDITAAIGILKNDKMDMVIQKLTEIGIKQIIPLITKRGVVKIDEKKDKWEKISNEAQKQCRGVKPTFILQPTKIGELNLSVYDAVIVPYENETGYSLMDEVSQKQYKKILYIIGPEGGFEEEEIMLLKKQGAKIVSLGSRILRAETAAIVTGGVLANVFR